MSEATAVVSLGAFLEGEQAECVSLQLLVGMDPNNRRAGVSRPVDGVIGDWAVFGTRDIVTTMYRQLDIDALYDALDGTATTT